MMNKNKNTTATNSNQIPITKKEGYHKKKYVAPILSQEDMNTIEGAQKRMDMAFSKFVLENHWSNVRVVEEFAPYISGTSAVSKILNGTQHVSLGAILLLSLRFGQQLDVILLGKKQIGYTLTPDDVDFLAELVKKANSCSDSKD